MNNNENKGTLTKVLRGLLVIGVIVAVVGVGVYFYFSDVEESPGNKITAGTLDLTIQETATISEGALGAIGSQNCETAQNGIECTVEISNIAPTDTGTIVWVLKNDGSLPGYLTVNAVVDNEQGGDDTEPEQAAYADGANGGQNLDLGDMVTATLTRKIDTNNEETLLGYEENEPSFLGEVQDVLNEETDLDMDSGNTYTYTLVWELPNTNSTFDNLAQGDTSTINLTFTLNQVENQGR